MKNFNHYYTLYTSGDEKLYDDLSIHTIKELERDCDKDLAKYYDFKMWLMSME